MAHSILLIASDINLRLSLRAILEKSGHIVVHDDCLCKRKSCLQEESIDLLFFAIATLNDVNLALIHMDKHLCQTTPVLFLCEPLFARRLQEIAESCRRTELLIKPVGPEAIMKAVQDLFQHEPGTGSPLCDTP